MRIFEFTQPEIKPLQIDKEVLYTYIRKNCHEYLSKSKGTMMYHGIWEDTNFLPSIYISHSPIGRMPVDLSPVEQTEIDRQLKVYGFKALRSNSIFCSGEPSVAAEYGSVYMIWPFDGFNFTWARNIDDAIITKDKKGWLDGDIVKRYNFDNTDLHAAISSGHEIYINGKYLAVSPEFLESYMKLRWI